MAPSVKPAPIWWSNAVFFVGMHLAGLAGVLWIQPWNRTSYATRFLCLVSWEFSSIGISLGYHRLWSHRSFTARKSLRIALALMGSLGFQGSIQCVYGIVYITVIPTTPSTIRTAQRGDFSSLIWGGSLRSRPMNG
ncbi:hypothetical protein FRB95_000726 [Tulasnella sp. JGI-2019a]|nr:hypothetical protein FRB95_000726 [Tulasnella sp. JGI-2019a]